MNTTIVYKCARTDMIECVVFQDGKVLCRTYMKREPSATAYIDTANIHLSSAYDAEQTLIPGVTKRVVKYAGRDLEFGSIRWNDDETYSFLFCNEEVQVIPLDKRSFAFRKGDETVATIARYRSSESVSDDRYRYDPVYQVTYTDDISQQTMILVMSFPMLYFGF